MLFSQSLFLIIRCRLVSFSMLNLPWFIFSSPGRSLKPDLSMASKIYSQINMRSKGRAQCNTYFPIAKVLVRKNPLPTQCVFKMNTILGREGNIPKRISLSLQSQDSCIDFCVCLAWISSDLNLKVDQCVETWYTKAFWEARESPRPSTRAGRVSIGYESRLIDT